MTFQEAVEAAPMPVCESYRPGKQALKAGHRKQVTCSDPRCFTGSVDLDGALRDTVEHRQANRWDYGIGFREEDEKEVAIWVEVHPASAGEVKTVIEKYRWLLTWLRVEAPALGSLSKRSGGSKIFFWLATEAGVNIRRGSLQARRLQSAGLDLPRYRLQLK